MVRKMIAALLLGGASVASAQIPEQTINQTLRAQLPEKILKAGKVVSVNNGSFPPYTIALSSTEIEGASYDFAQAIGQMLGIRIEHLTVNGLAAQLSGIAAGRYDFAIGPVGDYPSRQKNNDFVDYVKEYVVFAVTKGNPTGLKGLDNTCGRRVAVMASGSAEQVIKNHSQACVAQGKPAVNVMSFTDQPTAILAVRSKRADAFFSSQAPLTYFVTQAKGDLELTGLMQKNGFEDIYQGIVVAKNSPLGPLLRDAFNLLIENGTYAAIMKKWNLENNQLDRAGINLSNDMSK